jgi:hypothetical protein
LEGKTIMSSLKITVLQSTRMFFPLLVGVRCPEEALTSNGAPVQPYQVARRQGGLFAKGFLANRHKQLSGFLPWEDDTGFRHEMF